MSGLEQVLFLVVVPAVIVVVVWALASIGGPQAAKRYRPGRPYEFTPVWYLANHRHGPRTTAATQPELPAGSTGAAEITGSGEDRPSTAPAETGREAMQGTTGGASDRW